MSSALDLYAKAEALLGVNEAAPELYAHYIETMMLLEFRSLLDVGCGGGAFLEAATKHFGDIEATGCDSSAVMVQKAQARGIRAQHAKLDEIQGSYDLITAVFDVLNYMDSTALQAFFKAVQARLNPGGYFLCDLTTRYGFESIASGLFHAQDALHFVAVEGVFDAPIYRNRFTLFEKEGECYRKSEGEIVQYLYETEEVIAMSGLKPLLQREIFLYSDEEADKLLLLLQKG